MHGKFKYLNRILRGVEIHNPSILESSLKQLAQKYKDAGKSVYLFEYNSALAPQSYTMNKLFDPKTHYLSINNSTIEKALNKKFSLPSNNTIKPWTLDHILNHNIFEFNNVPLFKHLKNVVVISGSSDKTSHKNYVFLRGWLFGYFFDTSRIVNNQMKKLNLTDFEKANEITMKEQRTFDQCYGVTHSKYNDKIASLYKHQMDENSQLLEFVDLSYYESVNRKLVNPNVNRKHKNECKLFPPKLLSSMALSTVGLEYYNISRDINNPTSHQQKPMELLYNVEKVVVTHADSALRILSKRQKDIDAENMFTAFQFRSKLSFRMEMIYDIEPLAFIAPNNPHDFALMKRNNLKAEFASQEDINNGNVSGVYSYQSIRSYFQKTYPNMKFFTNVSPNDVVYKNYEYDGPAVIMHFKPSSYLLENIDKIDFVKFRRLLTSIVFNPKKSILFNLTFLSTENVIEDIKKRVDLNYYANTDAIDISKEKFFELYELFDEITTKWNLAYDDFEILESDLDAE